MPTQQKKNSSPSWLYTKYLDYDFLGAPVGFSMGGKKTHDTFCGASVSIFILVFVLMYLLKLIAAAQTIAENPILSRTVQTGYFESHQSFSN